MIDEILAGIFFEHIGASVLYIFFLLYWRLLDKKTSTYLQVLNGKNMKSEEWFSSTFYNMLIGFIIVILGFYTIGSLL